MQRPVELRRPVTVVRQTVVLKNNSAQSNRTSLIAGNRSQLNSFPISSGRTGPQQILWQQQRVQQFSTNLFYAYLLSQRDVKLKASSSASASSEPNDKGEPKKENADDTSSNLPSGQDIMKQGEELYTSTMEKIVRLLRDFGFGKRNIWEGGVGLFIIFGVVLFLILVSWLRGASFNRGKGYMAILEFPNACGVTVGTPVRVRGVVVGSVVHVKPYMDRVDVKVEVYDRRVVIPLSSEVLANQCGLVAEPIVDIEPRTPLPTHKASPLDSACHDEGVIVCHNDRIAGERGVSLDELVLIMTRMAQQIDNVGMEELMGSIDSLAVTVQDAQPLVSKLGDLVDEVTPILEDLRSTKLVDNIEALTTSAAESAAEVRTLLGAVLDDSNKKSLKASVRTLTGTLEHLEKVAGNVVDASQSPETMDKMRKLINAISRFQDE